MAPTKTLLTPPPSTDLIYTSLVNAWDLKVPQMKILNLLSTNTLIAISDVNCLVFNRDGLYKQQRKPKQNRNSMSDCRAKSNSKV